MSTGISFTLCNIFLAVAWYNVISVYIFKGNQMFQFIKDVFENL